MMSRLFPLLLAVTSIPLVPAAARDLTILVRGAPDAAAAILAAPFTAATGLVARADGWDGSLDTLRARTQPDGAGADLVLIATGPLTLACAEGTFVKIAVADAGQPSGSRAGVSAGDCGTPARLMTTGLAWDRAKVAGVPDWSDFFDVAKHPGRRGLLRGPRGVLEIALLADGVPAGDVYRTLRTQDGLDRAFRKLDQVRPYLIWYDTGEQAQRLLTAGDVLMTSAPAGSFPAALAAAGPVQAGKSIGWQPANGVAEPLAWAIPAASPMRRDAAAALAFASLPAVAAHLAAAVPDVPLAPGAQAFSPEGPTALILDDAFWQENAPAIVTRFAAWLTH